MGWLITIAILLLLGAIPLGVRLSYDESGLQIRVIAGPVRVTVFPFPKKNEKKKETSETPKQTQKQQPAKPKEQTTKETQSEPKKGGSLMDFLPMAKLGRNFLGELRRKLRVNHLMVHLIVAGDDPCDVGILYGRAWAMLANVLPNLERMFVIQKRDLEVECDFTSNTTTLLAGMDITITLGRIICLAVKYGIQAVAAFLRIQKNRKGGA